MTGKPLACFLVLVVLPSLALAQDSHQAYETGLNHLLRAQKKKEYDDAHAAFVSAIVKAPRKVHYHASYNLGLSHFGLAQYEMPLTNWSAAIQAFDNVLKTDSGASDLMRLLARYNRALANQYKAELLLQKKNPNDRTDYARARRAAISDYEAASRAVGGGFPPALDNLALVRSLPEELPRR